MKDENKKSNGNNNNYSRFKERTAHLAESINLIKERGIDIVPHEPIEGKMFWNENE